MKKLLNINKIEKMARLAFLNCLRLHGDSIYLYKNGSYPSAYFLSIISLEELGKVLLLSSTLFHTRGNEMDRASQEMWIESIFSHQDKQGVFAYEFMLELPKPFMKFIRE
ncbi:MAG: AbiV family abortive infection protein, partial [Planktothrix sp.]